MSYPYYFFIKIISIKYYNCEEYIYSLYLSFSSKSQVIGKEIVWLLPMLFFNYLKKYKEIYINIMKGEMIYEI